MTDVLKRNRVAFVAAGLVVAVTVGVLIATMTGGTGSDDEPDPAPQATAKIVTPSATTPPKVDIATTKTMPYSEVWNPPDEGQDFWQVVDPANGYPEDGGTDFLLAHACRDQGCAGDQIRALEVDDAFTYRGEQFVVLEKLQIHKSEIADQDIWVHDPDRVVVITCILDPQTGEYEDNDIIVASRA